MPENSNLCPTSKPKSLRNKSRKFKRIKVLKMLAVMERQQGVVPGEPVNSHSQEFLTSGRTGRRNALPDILSEHAVVTSADLPARLQALSTRDEASTSSYNAPKTPEGAGPSKQGGQNNAAS
ncbi:PREDICTED: cAMP-dependent protein kinase inhibitor beta-like isoform X2 [Nicrophorus vespilloides]|nr:PREDICTED: cAMP-dependent protein kinase inhibitor beta-like isoform X2 [Nicrophorus vespilloides]